YMRAKARALPFEVALETIVVEASLADGDNLRLARFGDQQLESRLGSIGVIAMHADARVEIGVPDGARMHARPGVHLDADAKRMRHGVRAHCLQHLRQLVGELRKIEMTVGIDEHGI